MRAIWWWWDRRAIHRARRAGHIGQNIELGCGKVFRLPYVRIDGTMYRLMLLSSRQVLLHCLAQQWGPQ